MAPLTPDPDKPDMTGHAKNVRAAPPAQTGQDRTHPFKGVSVCPGGFVDQAPLHPDLSREPVEVQLSEIFQRAGEDWPQGQQWERSQVARRHVTTRHDQSYWDRVERYGARNNVSPSAVHRRASDLGLAMMEMAEVVGPLDDELGAARARTREGSE